MIYNVALVSCVQQSFLVIHLPISIFFILFPYRLLWNIVEFPVLYNRSLLTILCMLLSHFSRVRLCATPQIAAHQAPQSLGFSRQEHWSGLPFPSPVQESEKSKWSHSVMSDSSRPNGLQPTRLLHPWDFPGKSTGVGCHCLLGMFAYKVLSDPPSIYHFGDIICQSPPTYLGSSGKQFNCNAGDRGASLATVHGITKSWTWLSDFHQVTQELN